MPYLIFKFANQDFEVLKKLVKGKKEEEVSYDDIINQFFNRKGSNKALWRILVTILVKMLYVIVNVTGLLVVNSAMNGEFLGYGSSWIKWLGEANFLLFQEQLIY